MLENNINVSWLPWFQMEKKKKIFNFLWQKLTFDTFCGSFDYVLTLGAFSKFCIKSLIPVTCLEAPKSMY